LPAAGLVIENEFVLEFDTCWTVVVVDESSRPVAGAEVDAYSARGSCSWPTGQAMTDHRGRVEICEVSPNRAAVRAIATGFQKLHITNDEGADPFQIELPAAGSLEGRLVPYKPGDCPCITFFDGVGVDLTVSDDGTFTLEHVPPGSSSASFHTSWGFWLPETTYLVEAGQVTDIGIVPLEPSPPTSPPSWRLPLWNPVTP
jgi:hypothetical protein